MTTTLLRPDKLLDLTQPLGPATILWPGSRPFAADVEADYDSLTRLERVPPRGAWLVAAALPIVEGSGAPARDFVVLP